METRPVGSKYWQCSRCGMRFASREIAQTHVCARAGGASIVEVEGVLEAEDKIPVSKTKL